MALEGLSRNGVMARYDDLRLRLVRPETTAQLSKGSSQPDSQFKRFDRVENVAECRRGRWRYLGCIRVVNVVVAAV